MPGAWYPYLVRCLHLCPHGADVEVAKVGVSSKYCANAKSTLDPVMGLIQGPGSTFAYESDEALAM